MDHRRHRGQHGESCFGCKVHSIQVSPSAMPSRRNNIAPARPLNSFEKGVLRDDRGYPVRRANGDVIGLHEYGSNRRQIDADLKAVKQGVLS